MVDKELIEIWRNMLKPSISSLLLKTNYEGMGEQDKEEFERDFDEILDLALIGLKHKAQLSQEGTTKGTTTDTISRQVAITALSHMCSEDEKGITVSRANVDSMLKSLPSAQPEERTEKHTETHACDLISRQAAIDALDCINGAEEVLRALPPAQPEREKGKWSDGYRWQRCSLCKQTGKKSWNYCPNCGADMRGEKDG